MKARFPLFVAIVTTGMSFTALAWDDPMLELTSDVHSISGGEETVSDLSVAGQISTAQKMVKALRKMETDWNQGDLEGFLSGYWNAPAFVFVSGNDASLGWKATRLRYQNSYADGLGKVAFTEITPRKISESAGILLCRWTLDFGDRTLTGYASFLFEQKAGRWLVTHEHASH